MKPGLITTKLPINPTITAVHLFIPTFSHFIDCITNNDIPLVSAHDGIDALKLAVKIEK